MAASSDSTKASSVAEEIITVVDKKTTERVSVTAEEEGLDRSEPLVDYAGSSEKTDPEEIRLVRKLDFWMLVSPHSPLPGLFPDTHHWHHEGSRFFGSSTS